MLEGKTMTVRDELHKIVDELPEEELLELRQFVNDLKDDTEEEETVTAESLAAIREGLEDLKAGRTTSWEQIKRESRLDELPRNHPAPENPAA